MPGVRGLCDPESAAACAPPLCCPATSVSNLTSPSTLFQPDASFSVLLGFYCKFYD